MKPVTPEFSRPLEIARVPATGCHERLNADAGECAALAQRLGIPAIHGLGALLKIAPWRGGGLKVTGEVTADIEQQSVISLENFRQDVVFAVERYFVSKRPEDSEPDSDIDLLQGPAIDLGEIVAETLGLELDPYPRKPGEEYAASPEPVPAKVMPFATLAKLKGGKT